jgi:magnesium transporter
MPDEGTWMDLLDPDEVALRRALPDEIHPSATERMMAPPRHGDEPRPRLETHGDHLFGVLVVPVFDPGAEWVEHQEVDVVVSRERMVTVRKTPERGTPISLDEVRRGAVRSNAPPGMCLYRLFDDIAERFLSLVDAFDDGVDELEDVVEDWPPARLRERISELRHDMLHVRRVLAPTRDAARQVLDDRVELEGEELFPREIEIHFADAYDKLLRAADGLDLARDLLAGVRDYHQAKVANDQNEVMKRLTVVASVLLLPTFIVGLYGQNLKGAPEFAFRYGYAWSWGIIVVTTIAQLVYFRRKKWI